MRFKIERGGILTWWCYEWSKDNWTYIGGFGREGHVCILLRKRLCST